MNETPPIPSPTGPWPKGEQPTHDQDSLTCPYCEFQIPFTWKDYFTFSLRYRCTQCERKSKVKFTLGYFKWVGWMFLITLGVSVGVIIILSLIFGQALIRSLVTPIMTGVAVILVIMLIPFDKKIQAKRLRLVKLPE